MVGSLAGINNGAGFQSTDVGRNVRFQITPPVWNSGTTYGSTGAVVHYPGNFTGSDYVSIDDGQTNLNLQPDINLGAWTQIGDRSTWSTGVITSINSTSSVQVALSGTLQASSPLIQYRLGLFTKTGGVWPTIGTYYEGRVFFGGGNLNNLLIASDVGGVSPGVVSMGPTDGNGNVLDTSAITYTVLGQGVNVGYWMIPDNAGIILGTASGEWIVQSSQPSNGVITPTSIQIHQTTRYGSGYAQAVRPGIAILFIDRFNNTLVEYLLDPFSQKYGGRPLNFLAADITHSLFEIEYQSVPNPVLWTLYANGLAGCLYRRVSYFASEMPVMYGWHNHVFGTGQNPTHMANSASTIPGFGSVDQLYLLAPGPNGGYSVDVLEPPFQDTDSLESAWFVDEGSTGINPASSPLRYDGVWAIEGTGATQFIINGLWDYRNKTVSLFLGGLDFGDYVVSATGYITVPYASDSTHIGARAYLQSVAVASSTPGSIPINMAGTVYWVPGVVGYPYTTTITRMRPDHQEDARTPNGPAAALRKRHYWYGLQVAAGVASTMQISGDATDTFYPVALDNDKTGQSTPMNQLFQGVWRDTIESDYNLDGQMTITLNRPVPMTLTQITGFLETEEI
jgi:hypothetical protein